MTATITLTVAQLHQALSPVIPLAAGTDTVPMLHAVYLQTRGAVLTATATDRYRVGTTRTELERRPRRAVRAIVPLDAAKHIRRTWRAVHRDAQVPLTLRFHQPSDAYPDGSLVITGPTVHGATTLTVGLLGGKYPDLAPVYAKVLTAPSVATVNPGLLASFQAAAINREPMILRRRGDDDPASPMPLGVEVGDHFIGALGQVRFTSPGQADAPPSAWAELLGID